MEPDGSLPARVEYIGKALPKPWRVLSPLIQVEYAPFLITRREAYAVSQSPAG